MTSSLTQPDLYLDAEIASCSKNSGRFRILEKYGQIKTQFYLLREYGSSWELVLSHAEKMVCCLEQRVAKFEVLSKEISTKWLSMVEKKTIVSNFCKSVSLQAGIMLRHSYYLEYGFIFFHFSTRRVIGTTLS